jgi:hypothetical protein
MAAACYRTRTTCYCIGCHLLPPPVLGSKLWIIKELILFFFDAVRSRETRPAEVGE